MVKFLGTAGARFVMARQLRSSAGVYLKIGKNNVILDPGPGTLLRCAKSKPPIDPLKINIIILTHIHIDHSGDLNVMVDAMTEGGMKKRGLLFLPEEAFMGEDRVLFSYLREFPKEVIILKENEYYEVGDLSFTTSVRHRHGVETYGIKIHLSEKEILSFMVDTEFFPELINSYKDSTTLVINVVRYTKGDKIPHLSMEDVKEVVSKIRPKRTILTHFGMTMLRAKPWEVAERLSKELELKVMSASDGMAVEI